MSSVREWASIICLAVLACSMLEIITPSGKMEKMMRFVFGVFMIFAMITPMVGTMKKVSIDVSGLHRDKGEVSRFEKKIDKQIVDSASENIKHLVIDKLKSINIAPQKIDIFMDTLDESCISIIKVTIYISKKDAARQEEVKKIVEESLDLETNVFIC